MATADRKDPYRGFNFTVELEKTSGAVAGFREASGMSFTTDATEYREGSDPDLHVRKLMGLRKYANITLKRGVTRNTELWRWYEAVVNGDDDRRNGAIVMRDEHQAPVLRWQFVGGWICKYESSALNATDSQVAVETVEIVVEKCHLV
jgi:phage tail-like protein